MPTEADGPRWYGYADVDRLISFPLLIERLRLAFAAEARGELVDRAPETLRDESLGTNIVAYPALWRQHGLASVKVLTAVDGNGSRGKSLIDAVLVAIDPVDGSIKALLDGRRITACRTAAVSALAVDALAAPDADTVAIIGTGEQAIAHAEAIRCVRTVRQIRIASAGGSAHRAAMAAAEILRRTGIPCTPATPVEALGGASIVACCSLSRTPVVRSGDLGPDAVVVCVSRFTPDAAELDPTAVASSFVVADSRARLLQRWGGRAEALARCMDLSDLLADAGRAPRTGRRVFLSAGRSFEDLVAVQVVLEASGSV